MKITQLLFIYHLKKQRFITIMMQETVTNSNDRKSLFTSFLEVLEAREKQAQADRQLQEEKYLRRTQRIYDFHGKLIAILVTIPSQKNWLFWIKVTKLMLDSLKYLAVLKSLTVFYFSWFVKLHETNEKHRLY